ncbi:2OG-Fe dioxygenase family protein [Nocardia sp. BMG51109]|uniref:2OG-Fe dioxygenase family protein n=1 Tax=Nocardia sp. BMG51109 TaxID=1056816 RepID=UPI0004666A5B|nr:2OG-Fe dioxygenase family protein [Nocardia sp. BMG51109]
MFDTELAVDAWLPAAQNYRHRAYQCFRADIAESTFVPVDPPPPYVQSRAVNRVFGGMERSFRTIPPDHPAVGIVTDVIGTVANTLLQGDVLPQDRGPLTIDVHYVRIVAPGKVAPEGIHRDGLIAGSIHLIRRTNITGGTTSVFDNDRVRLHSVDLSEPFDSLIFDDARVLHYTNDIAAADSRSPGYRDALLIGVRP